MKHRLFIIILLCGAAVSWAQKGLVPEKVYVHLDRTYFAIGETVWLKGYVENALPSPDTSRFLYVELIGGKDEDAVLRSKIRLGEDGFAGHLDLPEDMPGGRYMLRAYTRWQMNWPEEWMYHCPVDIYDGKEAPLAAPGDDYEVSFYPEGGRYFYGEYASVGFKVLSADGCSRSFTGKLYDDQGNFICAARTEHAGMGLLGFTPSEGRSYRLVSEADGRTWNLPSVSLDGATLQVRRVGGRFAVRTINRTGSPVKLDVFSPSGDSTGLQKFILTDQAGRILSERSVFAGEPSSTKIEAAAVDANYFPRKKWNVRFCLPQGIDSAELSVSVVRKAFRQYQQEGSLASYMLLGSEIRGYIEDPDYYFDTDVSATARLSHLDLLLLIQGWTYYDREENPSQMIYPKEQQQTLQGEVRSVFGRTPRKFTLTLMAPELAYSQVVAVPRGSRFMVDSLDFPDSTLFIVHVDNRGDFKRYYPVLNETFAPQWENDGWAYAHGVADRHPGRREVEPTVAFDSGDVIVDTLETAVIRGMMPRIRSPFGTSDLPNIKEREDLSFYDNLNLVDYVTMTHPTLRYEDEEMINTKTGYNNQSGEHFSTVALYVGGFQMPWDIAQTIRMSDVEKISVTTYMNSDAFLARSPGGIVLVELSAARPAGSLKDKSNSIVATPLGYQKPRSFYNPAYDRRRTVALPDRRNTVYWNPALRLGAAAKDILIETEDRADGPYFLRIEGRTSDGRWISTSQILY